MIKKILLILALLVVAGIAFIYFFGTGYLNRGVKKGIEHYGPQMTQTAVTVEDVHLSILSGKGSLKGLLVGNPEGFKAENILALGEIDLEVDTGTVFGDPIVINKIHIKQPAISYEKTLSGSNLQTLLNNIEEFTGPASAEEEEGPKKQVIIKELVIEEGTISLGMMGAGATIKLPRIEMTNIGENNRRTIAQAVEIILVEVLKAIGPALANNAEVLREGGKALLEDAASGAADRAGESIRGLLGR